MIEIAIIAAFWYIVIGALFVVMSEPRGVVADTLFFALWPLYLYIHIKHGR